MRSRALSWPLTIILAAGLAFRTGLLFLRGRQHDVTIFTQWERVLATFGTHGLYDHVESWSQTAINYPTGYALVLLGVEKTYEIVAPHGNLAVLVLLLKLPGVLADLACAALVYSIVMKYATRRSALVAAAIATFGPWTWALSAVQGQVDSVCTMFLLLALDFALEERFAASWVALAAGTLVKPFPVLVAPVLLVAQMRASGLSVKTFAGPVLALALAYIVSLPFAPTTMPLQTFAWLAHEYGAGQGLFPSTSFFAANVWTLASAPVPDTARIFGITLQTFGWVAFLAIETIAVVVMLRRDATVATKPLRAQALMSAWFVVFLALFVVTTRMHERYLVYALAIAPALWASGAWQRRTAVVIAITFVANFYLAYKFGSGGIEAFSTPAVRLVSFANVVTLAYAVVASISETVERRALRLP